MVSITEIDAYVLNFMESVLDMIDKMMYAFM